MTMTLADQMRLLSMVDVFDPLSSEEMEELARRAPDTHLQEGEVFLSPWERPAERLYVLKVGQVQIYEVNHHIGKETVLSVVDGGNIFGEMALTAQQMPGVYARATKPSVVSSLGRKDLERLILGNPEVGLRLVRRLSERLLESETRLAELIGKDVLGRLASTILRLADSEGVFTDEGTMVSGRYTNEQLGALIGAKRVAVSRAFKLLREAGAAEKKQRRIYVRDRKILERFAQGER
jgi:CRP/FNR family transcriptional regulator, cyclic AMP receptor protein